MNRSGVDEKQSEAASPFVFVCGMTDLRRCDQVRLGHITRTLWVDVVMSGRRIRAPKALWRKVRALLAR